MLWSSGLSYEVDVASECEDGEGPDDGWTSQMAAVNVWPAVVSVLRSHRVRIPVAARGSPQSRPTFPAGRSMPIGWRTCHVGEGHVCSLRRLRHCFALTSPLHRSVCDR